jgi:hypothetical protein
MTSRGTVLSLLPLLLAAACADRGGPTPEQRQARLEARLASCVAEEIHIKARHDLANLEALMGGGEEDDPPLGRAPHTFLRAYLVYADLRAREQAYLDSAYHAAAAADSARYMEAAQSFRLNPPSPGTVESNVVERYGREFMSAWSNPRHPCNVEHAPAGARR